MFNRCRCYVGAAIELLGSIVRYCCSSLNWQMHKTGQKIVLFGYNISASCSKIASRIDPDMLQKREWNENYSFKSEWSEM